MLQTTIISLQEAKEYLRILNSDEDQIIQTMIIASQQFAFGYLNNEKQAELIVNPPQDLKIALLDHIAFLYENRGNQDSSIPSRILLVYKRYKNLRLI